MRLTGLDRKSKSNISASEIPKPDTSSPVQEKPKKKKINKVPNNI